MLPRRSASRFRLMLLVLVSVFMVFAALVRVAVELVQLVHLLFVILAEKTYSDRITCKIYIFITKKTFISPIRQKLATAQRKCPQMAFQQHTLHMIVKITSATHSHLKSISRTPKSTHSSRTRNKERYTDSVCRISPSHSSNRSSTLCTAIRKR